MKAPSDSDSGFVLISVILAMSLLCLLGGLLQLQLTLVGTLVAEAETQMHSQVLAENGLELARAVVASPETAPGNGTPALRPHATPDGDGPTNRSVVRDVRV